MPWNEPLRVAERIALLDHLTKGRVRFGMGRGLSRREFGNFGIDMEESRDRFDEGSAMVKVALETGWIEGAGPHYPQPRAPIRPAPERSFADRLYAVASSDDSVEAAARLKARMTMFSDRSWKARLPSVERWRDLYRELPRRGTATAADLRLRLLQQRRGGGGHPRPRVHGQLPRSRCSSTTRSWATTSRA